MRLDQWSLSRSHTPQNDLCRKLICSNNDSRQAATILMDLGDCVMDHCIDMDQALAHASREAFHHAKERDLFNLGIPYITLFGELDPSYKGLIFPDCDLKIPDLESIIGNSIDPLIKERIIITVKQSHDRNQMKVQALDSTIRKLYEAASGLVNDGVETLRNYGLVHAVLDIRRQSIIRSSRLFRPYFDIQ